MTTPGRTWVALLRGINLGVRKRLAMSELRSLLESLGYADVRTYLQSGNAVFTAGGAARHHEQQIATRIESDLGLDVRVLVRDAAELTSVFESNPFVAKKIDPKQLHAAFLSDTPPAELVSAADPAQVEPDRFAFGDRVIYLQLPNGVMGSRLPDWGRLLGVAVTQRNWNTVTKLHTLASP